MAHPNRLVNPAARIAAAVLSAAAERRTDDVRRSAAEALELLVKLQNSGEAGAEHFITVGDAAHRAGCHEIALRARELALVAIAREGASAEELARVRIALALSLTYLGKYEEAGRLLRELIAEREREPEFQPGILALARGRLGSLQVILRKTDGARELLEESILTLSHLQPPPLRDLCNLQNQLGGLLDLSGFTERAEEQFRGALRRLELLKMQPASDELVALENSRLELILNHNLASVLRRSGRAAEAAPIARRVYESYQLAPVDGEYHDLWAAMNLSLVHCECGDMDSAKVVLQSVRDRILSLQLNGRPELFHLKLHFACNLAEAGDLASSEECIQALEKQRGEGPGLGSGEHALLQQIRAAILRRNGRLGPALELLEPILTKTGGGDRGNLNLFCEAGTCYYESGKLQKALAMQRTALAICEASLPKDHPDVTRARRALCATLSALGDWPSLTHELLEMIQALRTRLEAAELLSPREAEGVARACGDDLDALLTFDLSRPAVPDLRGEIFDIIERRRAIGSWDHPLSKAHGASAEIVILQERLAAARRRLADLAARMRDPASQHPAQGELLAAASARDEVASALRRALPRETAFPPQASADRLICELPADAAIISFHRYHNNSESAGGAARLVAHVVRRNAKLQRVELGPWIQIQEAIAAWMLQLFSGLEPAAQKTRGIGALRTRGRQRDGDASPRLRELLLEPLAEAIRGARILYVLPDGDLHSVPLDSLPAPGGHAGDHATWIFETSISRIVMNAAGPAAVVGGFLGAGGADFGMDPGAPENPRFEPLPASADEIQTIAELYKQSSGDDARILTKSNITKAALLDGARNASIVHFATHAFSSLKPPGPAEPVHALVPRDAELYLLQFSPMALCGLALSGANESRDGILTAEELAGFDLRGTSLAVLSACESHAARVGAGPSIPSLRAALHAAGVRASVTALWRVPDAAARDWMIEFYQRIFAGEPLGRAVWGAKKALAARGVPPGDWAPWIATGNVTFAPGAC